MVQVSILCTDPAHPVNARLIEWAQASSGTATVEVLRDYLNLRGGDFLFLVSCQQIVPKPVRDIYRHTLVLHASALPKGRGMSPHVWQILDGADLVTVTLLNAEDALDSGDIWEQVEVHFDGTELYDEINQKIFGAELRLMTWALGHCDSATPRKQQGEASTYRRRTPADSSIDPQKPLAESFNLLRVADPQRYPAFFDYRGKRYRIRIDKM
jgi:methionyl-tRNA formyltransferase